jgi:iron-sulfur cluster repair protein YtfE (RIC family)
MHTPALTDLADLGLNQVVQLCPEALAVFTRHGMDTCCGGSLPVREAAARHGVPLDDLLRELRVCAPPAP